MNEGVYSRDLMRSIRDRNPDYGEDFFSHIDFDEATYQSVLKHPCVYSRDIMFKIEKNMQSLRWPEDRRGENRIYTEDYWKYCNYNPHMKFEYRVFPLYLPYFSVDNFLECVRARSLMKYYLESPAFAKHRYYGMPITNNDFVVHYRAIGEMWKINLQQAVDGYRNCSFSTEMEFTVLPNCQEAINPSLYFTLAELIEYNGEAIPFIFSGYLEADRKQKKVMLRGLREDRNQWAGYRSVLAAKVDVLKRLLAARKVLLEAKKKEDAASQTEAPSEESSHLDEEEAIVASAEPVEQPESEENQMNIRPDAGAAAAAADAVAAKAKATKAQAKANAKAAKAETKAEAKAAAKAARKSKRNERKRNELLLGGFVAPTNWKIVDVDGVFTVVTEEAAPGQEVAENGMGAATTVVEPASLPEVHASDDVQQEAARDIGPSAKPESAARRVLREAAEAKAQAALAAAAEFEAREVPIVEQDLLEVQDIRPNTGVDVFNLLRPCEKPIDRVPVNEIEKQLRRLKENVDSCNNQRLNLRIEHLFTEAIRCELCSSGMLTNATELLDHFNSAAHKKKMDSYKAWRHYYQTALAFWIDATAQCAQNSGMTQRKKARKSAKADAAKAAAAAAAELEDRDVPIIREDRPEVPDAVVTPEELEARDLPILEDDMIRDAVEDLEEEEALIEDEPAAEDEILDSAVIDDVERLETGDDDQQEDVMELEVVERDDIEEVPITVPPIPEIADEDQPAIVDAATEPLSGDEDERKDDVAVTRTVETAVMKPLTIVSFAKDLTKFILFWLSLLVSMIVADHNAVLNVIITTAMFGRLFVCWIDKEHADATNAYWNGQFSTIHQVMDAVTDAVRARLLPLREGVREALARLFDQHENADPSAEVHRSFAKFGISLAASFVFVGLAKINLLLPIFVVALCLSEDQSSRVDAFGERHFGPMNKALNNAHDAVRGRLFELYLPIKTGLAQGISRFALPGLIN